MATALDVRVSRPTPTSAIARPTYESLARRARTQARTATPKQLLDTLTAALWHFLAGIDDEFAGWTRERGISRASDIVHVVDLLMRASGDDAFPYPGSPRYDSVGGGARIAPDGSPGVPPAWVRYFMRGHTGVSREEYTRSCGPLLLALGSFADAYPTLWRIYALRVIDGIPAARISMALTTPTQYVSVRYIQDQVAQARTLLLGYLALYDGAIDNQDFDYLVKLALPDKKQRPRQRTHR